MKYTKSKTGMYQVELARPHEHAGHLYKPSAAKTVVDQAILDDMIAAGVVTSVAAA